MYQYWSSFAVRHAAFAPEPNYTKRKIDKKEEDVVRDHLQPWRAQEVGSKICGYE
jgi:hypothetical protein